MDHLHGSSVMLAAANCEPIASASYRIATTNAGESCSVLMWIERHSCGYIFYLGSQVAVEFCTVDELRAMLPTFGADNEPGYEIARATVLEQFTAYCSARCACPMRRSLYPQDLSPLREVHKGAFIPE